MAKELKTDYCIAGGGVPGFILAKKLAQSGKKILLLDQGPHITETNRAELLRQSKETLNDFADYNDNVDPVSVTPHTSAPNKEADHTYDWVNYRLFGLGGTALHFEAMMLRPAEDDFKVKSLYGYGRNWPIDYAELEPWLLNAEYEIGVAANDDNPYAAFRSGSFPMPAHAFSYFDNEFFAPALKKLNMTGHSLPRGTNSKPYGGRSACMSCRICKFCPSGARFSPDRAILPTLNTLENVTVLPDVSLRKLETGSRGRKIKAAQLINIKDGEKIVVKAKNYILAMGGVETPRMLMLSADGSKHKNGLGNMGGQLGQKFNDHLFPYVTVDLGKHAGSRPGFETMSSDHLRVKLNRREQPGIIILGSPSMDWFPVGNEAVTWSTHDDELSLEDVRENVSQLATISLMTELEGEGTLELDVSTVDAFGSPVAKVTMKLTEWDRRANIIFADLASKMGEAMDAENISEVSPDGFGLGYHPSGATAMASNPDEGVCDENLKVFGLNNLYVVSNSVFPHMGANPPTLTIAALAQRLAAHLEGESAL
jgi:choline dehydrogenase-like flavoprotein